MPLISNTPKGRFWESHSLPVITTLTPGTYTNAQFTVDEYGRITTVSAGSGNTLDVQDEGAPVFPGSFSTFNFIGPGVAATNGGGGVLDIQIDPGGLRVDPLERNTNFAATVGSCHMVNTTFAPIIVTPPAGASVDDRFSVVDSRANASVNNITVRFTITGDNFYGTAQDWITNLDAGNCEFLYTGPTVGWVVSK